MRRFLLCLLVLVVAAPAWGQKAPENLRMGISQFPSDMHPFISNLLIRNWLLAISRRSVTRFDAAGETICQLCTEVPTVANGRAKTTVNPDGTPGMEVHFTLRPGLVWGDGVPLTSGDVAFGFDVEKAFAAPASVTGVQVVDARNYVVKMKTPRFDFDRLSPQPFPEHLEGAIFRAASDPLDYGKKSLFNRAPETPGLWNGPYLLTGFKPNESVTFAVNPRWDGERPYFKTIAIRLIENTAALQANLLSGDIDMEFGLTFDQALDLSKKRTDKFDISFVPALSTTFLYVNTENPLLADKRVRQAIMLGIDRKTLTERLFDGKQPVASSFLSPAESSMNKALKPWPYDPARARALLAEVGFKPGPDGIMVKPDGSRLSLDLLVSAGIRLNDLLQQVMQSQLKQIGIEIVAKSEPVRVLLGETVRKRLFPGLSMFTWTPAPGAIPQFTYHSARIPSAENSYGGTNYTGFRNARMDALLDGALAELDSAKRQVMFDEIQAIVMDELPQIPLYHGVLIFTAPKWLAGLTPTQSTALSTFWVEYWKGK